MDRNQAIEQIKEACANIAREMMRINPVIGKLEDKDTETKLYETVYQATSNIEVIKKSVIKLQGRDDSGLV